MYQYNLKNGRIDTFFLYYSNLKDYLITLFRLSTNSASTALQLLSPLKFAVIIISPVLKSVIVAVKLLYA